LALSVFLLDVSASSTILSHPTDIGVYIAFLNFKQWWVLE